jgi:hypothetical protein
MFVLPHRPIEELPKNTKVELKTGPGTPSEEGPMLSTTASKFTGKTEDRRDSNSCLPSQFLSPVQLGTSTASTKSSKSQLPQVAVIKG